MASKAKAVESENGKVELLVATDSAETDKLNAELRKGAGKGFTLSKAFRRVANIDGDEFNALLMLGDKNARDFAASGYSDARALRKLLSLHPEWRASEGSV